MNWPWKKKMRLTDRWLFVSGTSEVTDEVRRILVEAADWYLRAGGIMTPKLWCSLPQESRAAFATAGDRLRGIAPAPAGDGPVIDEAKIVQAIKDATDQAAKNMQAGNLQ